jgi:uncharacterized protein YpuA (DUF1002 family)
MLYICITKQLKHTQMEQLTDYQAQRIQALEIENARIKAQLDEAKQLLTQLLKELENGSI